MPTYRPFLPFAFAVLAVTLPARIHADDLDDYVTAQMKKHGVPGISLAIVDGGKIVSVRCYGVADNGTKKPVTPTTLFQAGSISKSVAAIGTLRLVEQGALDLDEDVNVKLKSWKVPENEFTKEQKVTLRRILSHTAGMTVHGFPGYAVDAPKPTLVEILNGGKPSNTPPIFVEKTPGTVWNYSGGGYTVMQLLLQDTINEPYSEYMKRMVLEPAGMTDSSYEQPQPSVRAARTAAGTYPGGAVVKGRWHVYPEMAAAGLWTTATDLAKFIISIQRSYGGPPGGVLSEKMTQEMLKEQKDGDGLGAFLEGKDNALRFTHSGRDEGFDALYVGYAKTGKGAAVMINANENSGVMNRILQFVGSKYNWQEYPRPFVPTKIAPVQVTEAQLDATPGYYSRGEEIIMLAKSQGKLTLRSGPNVIDHLIPQGGDSYLMPEEGTVVSFTFDEKKEAVSCSFKNHEGRAMFTMPRICGLLKSRRAMKDPDEKRLASVAAMLAAISHSPTTLGTATYLSAGARRDFAHGLDFGMVDSPEFLGEQDVSSRNMSRHGSKVAKVAEYRMRRDGKRQFLIVYLTAEGLITDVDPGDE